MSSSRVGRSGATLVGIFSEQVWGDSDNRHQASASKRLIRGTETQLQYFDVLIDGHDGRLMVRPTGLISAAVALIPAEHFAH